MSIRALARVAATCSVAALASFSVACGDNPAAVDQKPVPFRGTIDVLSSSFSPASVSITVGDSVTWRWVSGAHSVTQGTTPDPSEDPSRLFDSGVRSSGTFGYRFTSPGTVPYFCRPHFSVGMKGTITVKSP